MYGEQIKNWRKQHNLSQDKLSKATGIPQKTISWIESNEVIENIQQCVILADFYGISLDELIGREFKTNWL